MVARLSRGFVKFFIDFFSSKCTKIFWKVSELRKIGSARPPPSRAFRGYLQGVGACHVSARLETWTIDFVFSVGRKPGGVFRENKFFRWAKTFALDYTILKSIFNFGIRAKKKNGVKPRPFEKLYACQSSCPRRASCIGAITCHICDYIVSTPIGNSSISQDTI